MVNKYFYWLMVICCVGCNNASTNKTSSGDTILKGITKKEFSPLTDLDRKADSMKQKYAPVPYSILPQYLSLDTVNLELNYVTWGCACPPWIERTKRKWCDEHKQSYRKHVFYLEPVDTSKAIDKAMLGKGKTLKVQGVFYKDTRFPRGFNHWEQVGVIYPAKVLRYHSYEVKSDTN